MFRSHVGAYVFERKFAQHEGHLLNLAEKPPLSMTRSAAWNGVGQAALQRPSRAVDCGGGPHLQRCSEPLIMAIGRIAGRSPPLRGDTAALSGACRTRLSADDKAVIARDQRDP